MVQLRSTLSLCLCAVLCICGLALQHATGIERSASRTAQPRGQPEGELSSAYFLDSVFYNYGQNAAQRICSSHREAYSQFCSHYTASLTYAHENLRNGSTVGIEFDLSNLNVHSTGPFVLAALFCELARQGFPTSAAGPPRVAVDYPDCPPKQTQPWSLGLLEQGFSIIPEVRSSSALTERPTRVVKWLLGNHPTSTSSISQNAMILLPYSHEFVRVFKTPTMRLLRGPTLGSFLRESKGKSYRAKKANAVLVDQDAEIDIPRLTKAVRDHVPDAEIIKFSGFPRESVPALYARVKLVLDTRLVGYEGINTESVLFDTLLIVESLKVGSNALDFPIPQWARFDRFNYSSLTSAIIYGLLNYDKELGNFKALKKVWQNSVATFQRDVNVMFSSRDVFFRTSCRSTFECRSALAFVFSVWNVFPLAFVEILVPDVSVFWQINDGIATLLSRYFHPSLLAVTQFYDELLAQINFARPKYVHASSVMVIARPTMLFLSPDIVNEHVRYMFERNINLLAGGDLSTDLMFVRAEALPLPLISLTDGAAMLPTDILYYRGTWLFYITRSWAYDLEVITRIPELRKTIVDLFRLLSASPLFDIAFSYWYKPYHELISTLDDFTRRTDYMM